MKQKLYNRSLTRIPDGFVPAALTAAAVFGAPRAALILAACAYGVALPSLFSAFGLRAAFATQPAMRDVHGSVKAALLLQVGGYAVATALFLLLYRRETAFFLPMIAAGFLLNIEHIFYEYMYANSDHRGALLCHALTALLVAAALIAGAKGPVILAATGVSALVGCTRALAAGGGLKGGLNAQVVRCAPRAAIQCAAYPLVAALVSYFLLPVISYPAIFAGLTLYALCRTPFRRSRTEAPPMNRALLIVCLVSAAALLAVCFIPNLPPVIAGAKDTVVAFCAMLNTACACAFAVFGNISI